MVQDMRTYDFFIWFFLLPNTIFFTERSSKTSYHLLLLTAANIAEVLVTINIKGQPLGLLSIPIKWTYKQKIKVTVSRQMDYTLFVRCPKKNIQTLEKPGTLPDAVG